MLIATLKYRNVSLQFRLHVMDEGINCMDLSHTPFHKFPVLLNKFVSDLLILNLITSLLPL
jgi:hypothetical protein